MRRKKRLLTRRRRALRCAAAALVLLILAQAFVHTAFLLPIRLVRLREDQMGVQGARVIRRQWAPEVCSWSNLFYLTANDEAVLLHNIYFKTHDWWGWSGSPTHLLDCTAERPLHAAQELIYEDTGPGKGYHCYGIHYFFFGRVDDPAIETVEIRLQTDPAYEEAAEETAGLGYLRLNAPILRKDGRRYFLAYHYLPEGAFLRDGENRAIGRDREGNTVATLQIETTAHTSTGIAKGQTATENT